MPSAKKTHMVIDSTGQQSFLKRTGRQLAVGYLQSPVPKVDVETYEHYFVAVCLIFLKHSLNYNKVVAYILYVHVYTYM